MQTQETTEHRKLSTAKDKAEKAADGTVSGQRLKSFLEHIERVEEEAKGLREDIKDIYSEAKATGLEPKIMRRIISLRKTNKEKRREEQELLALYLAAIGQGELDV